MAVERGGRERGGRERGGRAQDGTARDAVSAAPLCRSPLDTIRASIASPGEAVRWACVLEATAPKAGNVHPGKSFADLSYSQFVAAAEIAGDVLGGEGRFSEQILQATRLTRRRTGTNVNLGILLLLGPLVDADRAEAIGGAGDSSEAASAWPTQIRERLSGGIEGEDAACIYEAIRIAAPGGLGESESMDVWASEPPVDLLEAMRQAAPRDRVARQYASGFRDLWDHVVPVVKEAIERRGDVLCGIADAHLRLLAAEPDTLIARKCGAAAAEQVRSRAAAVDPDDPAGRRAFDAYLRSDGHRLNPGTTADLIAAAIYVLLRCDPGV